MRAATKTECIRASFEFLESVRGEPERGLKIRKRTIETSRAGTGTGQRSESTVNQLR